jgi:hypothetical protein
MVAWDNSFGEKFIIDIKKPAIATIAGFGIKA